MRIIFIFLSVIVLSLTAMHQWACSASKVPSEYVTDTIFTNSKNSGTEIQLTFVRGKAHNHPLMTMWITDTNDIYIETLFIAESIGKGTFKHGDKNTGKWLPGAIRRPAALPVWSYSRGIKEADSLYIPTDKTPMPDAISGATPPSNFVLITKTSSKLNEDFYLYFEINQTWDWNEYWTNDKYPNNIDYQSSCQPALVYRVKINSKNKALKQELELIGHSHYSGENGAIYPDISSITTAKDISKSISVQIK